MVTVIVNLPPELEGRLKRAAEAEGVAEEQFVLQTLEQRLMDDRRQAALEMLRHWREEDATTDAAEIEERRRSWEAFKAGLNEHHTSGRKVFP
jgi:hypothetical protein